MLYFRSQHYNSPIEQSRNEGIYLKDLAEGAVVEIETQNHLYRLVKNADTQVRISGHPTYCPEPVDVVVEGSVARGCPLAANLGFIGRGMYLVLKHPQFDRITTARIRDIHKC
jgi:hypothetical protein